MPSLRGCRRQRRRRATIALARAAVERDLRYWRARRATAQVIPPSDDTSVVRFGSTVTHRTGGRPASRSGGSSARTRPIPKAGTLSHASPLARLLIGKAAGDTIRIADGEAEIIAIA